MALRYFDFYCTACSWEGEELIDTNDEAPTTCPECKLDALEKMLSIAGYRIEGDNSGSTRRRNLGVFGSKKK